MPLSTCLHAIPSTRLNPKKSTVSVGFHSSEAADEEEEEEEEDSHFLYGKPPPFSIALPIQLLTPPLKLLLVLVEEKNLDFLSLSLIAVELLVSSPDVGKITVNRAMTI